MQSISKQAKSILSHFSAYSFTPSEEFKWDPASNTIFHPPINTPEDLWDLVHEVSHAQLGHLGYVLDIELIKREAEAWDHALTVLGPQFDVNIDEEYSQVQLDTYRQWLHDRSTCPKCSQNGIQTTTKTYSCINCRSLWRVNDARFCNLRRITLQR